MGINVWDPTSGATNKMEFSPGPFVTDVSVTNYKKLDSWSWVELNYP